MVSEVVLTEEQAAAVDAAEAYLKHPDRAHMTLGGYAGTGKTTVLSALMDRIGDLYPNVVALSGKAVNVLRGKGLVTAQTIHSLIYIRSIADDKWIRVEDIPGRAIIVDEASMISEELYNDLVSFGLPILFVGDMGQLEPIGRDIFLMANPDVRLEKIHRQAEGNPIISLATSLRHGASIAYGDRGGGVIVGRKRDRTMDDLLWADQIIVGYNATRRMINSSVRLATRRRSNPDQQVVDGERLICLQNSQRWGVFNGQGMTVEKVFSEDDSEFVARVRIDGGDILPNVICTKRRLGRDDDGDRVLVWSSLVVDYGYAITAHKAQGSEWPKVVVVEECSSSWDVRRWSYTAATRAREELRYFC